MDSVYNPKGCSRFATSTQSRRWRANLWLWATASLGMAMEGEDGKTFWRSLIIMPLLYKYIPPKTEDGTRLPELILQTLRVSATDPRRFNDPFEVRPWFDQERQDHFVKSHESFYETTLGVKHSLMQGRSMVGIRPEDAVGFGERLNKRFTDELGEKFRVLCFSRNPKSILMWSHNTRTHAGIVIGGLIKRPVDCGFPTGIEARWFRSAI